MFDEINLLISNLNKASLEFRLNSDSMREKDKKKA